MAKPQDPVQSPNAEAREIASGLLHQSMHCALGVIREDGQPALSRIALAVVHGQLVTLISDLSHHTRALGAQPQVSLLLGEPGAKGDPLTHPRLTIQARAELADKAALRAGYLAARPKAQLYFDFADFRAFCFDPSEGFLNGGFGKAFQFTGNEMRHLIEKEAPRA